MELTSVQTELLSVFLLELKIVDFVFSLFLLIFFLFSIYFLILDLGLGYGVI